MRHDKLALILLFLIGSLILIFPPFVAASYVTVFIKGTLLMILTFFFLFLVIKQREFVFKVSFFIAFFFLEAIYWIISGDNLMGDIVYFIVFVVLAFSLHLGIDKIKGGKALISNFYLLLVLAFSILSIISFFAFNFNLLPFTLKPVGDDAFYTNFHNPILGYISLKRFEFGNLGRVCGYLFEPSYLGWFLTVNFFLLDQYSNNRKRLFSYKIIVFFGAMGTCSTMTWVVFPLVFGIKFFYAMLGQLKIRGRFANSIFVLGFLVGIGILFIFVPKQKLVESLGTSSADDRENRIGTSLLIIANSSPRDILFGRSPGYVERNFERGESNQFIKLLVEYGLISTLIITMFVIYCTYKSKYFMIANLLFLNSVVILITPLFIINLLICKWNDDNKNL